MKIFHLSDLHIGKTVHEYNMKDSQLYILNQILERVKEEKPDAVIIAGDVYDKTVPSVEAVNLLDYFLTELSIANVTTYIISGNHDSSYRLNFASRLLENNNIIIEGVFNGAMRKETKEDEFGKINFYMLPFVRPVNVREHYKEESIESYNDAVKKIMENTEINTSERNILIAHQFVTGAVCSESEVSVGTVDNVDGNLFEDFDYVALGHIHKPQKMLRETMRYSGTPLPYSFSEKDDVKSITVVDFKESHIPDISFIPLNPLRKMVEVTGTLEDILKNYEGSEDYVKINLTDEGVVIDAAGKLRNKYPNLMLITFRERQNIGDHIAAGENTIVSKDKMLLFADFYKEQTGEELADEDMEYLRKIMKDDGEAQE